MPKATTIDLTVRLQVFTAMPQLIESIKKDLEKAGWKNPEIQKTSKMTLMEYRITVSV